jgi:hypothetical protein
MILRPRWILENLSMPRVFFIGRCRIAIDIFASKRVFGKYGFFLFVLQD